MITRRAFLYSAAVAGIATAFETQSETVSDVPIVDCHTHFWDPSRLEYPWLKGSPIAGAKLPADYFRESAGCHVERVVFVQAECRPEQAAQEAQWVETLARQERRIGAIVAFAPVEDAGKIGPALETLARNPLVKGVRRLVQGEPDPDFCARPDFISGVKHLAGRRWTFEIGVRAEQLPAAARLVQQCPEINFTLDHLGNPNIAQGSMHPWAEHVRRLAAFPNVACKISGAITRADWKTWTTGQLRPFVEHVFDSFGFDRVMFGGDWPVCLPAGGWRRWLEALREITASRTLDDRRRLFAKNAQRCYGL